MGRGAVRFPCCFLINKNLIFVMSCVEKIHNQCHEIELYQMSGSATMHGMHILSFQIIVFTYIYIQLNPAQNRFTCIKYDMPITLTVKVTEWLSCTPNNWLTEQCHCDCQCQWYKLFLVSYHIINTSKRNKPSMLWYYSQQ